MSDPLAWSAPDVTAADAQGFVAHYFDAPDLPHKARNACFARVARQISRPPGGTLPEELSDPNDYLAMDRLMNRPEVTHQSVPAAPYRSTPAKMHAQPGVVLILHDTTVLDYSGNKAPGLAAVGNGNGTGYLCHNSLAVEPHGRQVLGLVSQLLRQRVAVPRGETVRQKRERQTRESRLGSRGVRDLPVAPEGHCWVGVCDRGADLFEYPATEQQLGRVCVVRSAHNRRIRIGHDGQGDEALLHTYLRTLPAVGARRPREIYDRKRQALRTAALQVSFAAVEILPPHVKKGEYPDEPIRAWGVRVWEESPPAGGAKSEWFLACLHPVADAAGAWQACEWYACRWRIEELHKAKKTGCRIEDLQFRTEQALQPMIALRSVVAVQLLNLREAARRPDARQRKASEVVAPIYRRSVACLAP